MEFARKNILTALGIIYCVIAAFASTFAPHSLWGFGFYSYDIQLTAFALCGAAVFVKLFPKIQDRVSNRVIWIPIALAALGLTIQLPTQFMGDGFIFLSFIKKGALFYPSNFPDFFLHSALYNYVLKQLSFSPVAAYSVIGSISFFVYAYFAIAYLDRLTTNPAAKLPVFCLMVFAGYTLQFYGYVESYSTSVALLCLYLYFGYRTITENRLHAALIPVFLLTVLFHQIFALLAPSLLFVLYPFIVRSKFSRPILISAIILLAIGIFTCFLFSIPSKFFAIYSNMLKSRGVLDFKLFLPLWNGDYAIFSKKHLLDYFNVSLLASPFAYLALILLPYAKWDKSYLYLFLAYLPLEIFFFCMNSGIGLHRDWDLYAFKAEILTFIAAKLVIDSLGPTNGPHKRSFLFSFAVVACFLSWLGVNWNASASVKRLLDIAEFSSYPIDAGHDYEMIADFYGKKGDPGNQVLYYKKAYQFWDNARICNNIGMIYASQGKSDSAEKYLVLAFEKDSTQEAALFNLGKMEYQLKRYDASIRYLQRYIEKHPGDLLVNNMLIKCFLNTGNLPAAAQLTTALLEKHQDAELYNNLGNIFFLQKQYQHAATHFQKAMMLSRSNPNYCYNLSLAYSFFNEDSARYYQKQWQNLKKGKR